MSLSPRLQAVCPLIFRLCVPSSSGCVSPHLQAVSPHLQAVSPHLQAVCPLIFRLCPLIFRLCPLIFRLCPLICRLCPPSSSGCASCLSTLTVLLFRPSMRRRSTTRRTMPESRRCSKLHKNSQLEHCRDVGLTLVLQLCVCTVVVIFLKLSGLFELQEFDFHLVKHQLLFNMSDYSVYIYLWEPSIYQILQIC